MNRRAFLAWLAGLSLIPTTFGAYSLIRAEASIEFPLALKGLPAPKELLGVPVPEGMDLETLDQITIQAYEEASHKMPLHPITDREEALFEALAKQDPYLVETGRKIEEIVRRIGENTGDEVLFQAIVQAIGPQELFSFLEKKRRINKEVERRLKEEGYFDEEALQRYKELRMHQYDELIRAELRRLFAEWERQHKAR